MKLVGWLFDRYRQLPVDQSRYSAAAVCLYKRQLERAGIIDLLVFASIQILVQLVENQPVIKLCDFGFSKDRWMDSAAQTQVRVIRWGSCGTAGV